MTHADILAPPPDADDSLRETVRRAYEGSEFFRTLLTEAGCGPDTVQTVADIPRLPFTTKDQLRAAYPFGWTVVPQRDVIRIHASSGTTGQRTLCTYTRRDIADWVDMFSRCLAYAGISADDTVQVAAGYGLWTAGWGIQAAAEHLGAMAVPIGPGKPELHLEFARDLASTALVGTASFARLLGERAKEAGMSDQLAFRVALLGAEAWGEPSRARIQELLGVEAFDLYGLTELWGPGAGAECSRHDGIHIWSDHYYLEIVDPDTGEVLPPGTEGEIVVTAYRKEATPLLRYRTRDRSSLYADPCPCGSPYPRIARITGRTDDMVKVRGVLFFPSQVEQAIARAQAGDGEFQIHLGRRPDGKETLLVKAEAQDRAGLVEDLAAALTVEIGLHAEVEVVPPGTLPRTDRKSQRIFDTREA